MPPLRIRKGGSVALIPVEQAELGMVLSSPVTDRRGRLIMPAGKALEEKHLDALPMWGISHIEVEGAGPETHDDPLEKVAPWALAQAGEEMDGLFLHANNSHPVIRELKALRTARRALAIQGGGQP
jgi:hypothetical protein